MTSRNIKSTKPKWVHQKEVGTERCGHTCSERVCTNMKGSLDWEKERHSVQRHESSRKCHPKYAQGCPCNFKLQPTAQSGKGKEKSSATPSAPTTSTPTPSTPSDIPDDQMDIGLPMDVDPQFDYDATDCSGPSDMPVAGPLNVGNGIIMFFLSIYSFTNYSRHS